MRAEWVVVCALLACGCRQGEDEPVAARATPAPPEVRVADAVGTVEVQASNGGWRSLRAGERLAPDAILRTGSSGEAVLSLGTQASVRVAARTELSIAELEQQVSRVRLQDGRVTAVVSSDARLVIESGAATAESGAGELSALSSDGRLVVASRTAKVRLTAAGRSVDLAPGEQAVASGDTGPTAPVKIPASLFVKLGAPRSAVQRERTLTVTGETAPGAVVSVNGVRVGVTADGSFRAPVPLQEGRNRVEVVVTDALGRRESQALPEVTVDSRVGETKAGVTWE